MEKNKNISNDEAQAALENVSTMESAAYGRAVPHRWLGAGVAFLIACLFALYALENPYPYTVFPIIGLAILLVASRDKSGAYAREFPDSKSNKWAFLSFIAVLILVFFGMVFIRRAYDLSWVPIAVGLLVGLVVFLLSESERRSYLAKAGGAQQQ